MSTVERWEIRVPKTTEWTPAVAGSLMNALLGIMEQTPVSLHIKGSADGIRFVLCNTAHPTVTQRSLSALIHAYYPAAEVVPYTLPAYTFPFYRRFAIPKRVSTNWFDPFTAVSDHKTFDPLTVVAQTMQRLEPGDLLTYMIMVDRVEHLSEQDIENMLTMSAYDAGWRTHSGYVPLRNDWVGATGALIGMTARWLGNRRLKNERVLRYSESETAHIASKIKQPLVVVTLRLTIDTPKRDRLGLLSALCGATYNLTGGKSDTRIVEGITHDLRISNQQEADEKNAGEFLGNLYKADNMGTAPYTFWVLPDELAALWHLPHADFAGLPITWASRISPHLLANQDGNATLIGTLPDTGKPVFLTRQDRAFHAYIAGKTGMGKSTLLHTLIHQDIAQGEGVAVIDPHGKLIADILAHSIPANRVGDIVVLDCNDTTYPVPLNPFRIPQGVSYETTFNYLYWIFRKVYESIWREGRMDVVIRNILQALLSDPDATPLDIARLFSDTAFRHALLKRIQADENGSLSVEMFWRDFEHKSSGEKDQLAAPILNRTSAFLGNRQLEAMMCHPTTLNFPAFITGKKIVLINLAGEAIRSEVGSLGAVFLAAFTMASETVSFLRDQEPPRYYLYVDEVERIVTTPLPDMFAHERKFGLSLTLANQYLDQLDTDTLRGILGNVGSTFLFELSDHDAKTFASTLAPDIASEELTKLGAYRMVVKTRAKGENTPAFILRTNAAPTEESATPPEALRTQSHQTQGFLPAADVRTWLKTRYTPPKTMSQQSAEPSKGEVTDYE